MFDEDYETVFKEEEPTKKVVEEFDGDYDSVFEELIKDEEEAVDGYNKSINELKDDVEAVKKLEEIKNDELEHIEELNKLKLESQED